MPALLIGIKWGCLGTLGTFYGLDQGFILGEGEGGERRAPYKPSAYWKNVKDTHNSKGGQYGLKGQYMDLTKVHTRRRRRKTSPL